jgi:hypothetical protein
MPRLRLVNMIAEPSPTSEQGVALISRLPLVMDTTVGAGPINGIFQQDGVFNGDTFVLSGNKLYRGAVLLGTITGTGPVSWAASANEVVVTRGGDAFSYNGTNLAAITLPNGDRPVIGFRAVAFVAGLFIFVAITDGTVPNHYWFWSAINNARTIDSLDFAAAESEPDELLDAVAVGDTLYLLGSTSGEVWQLTGAANLPFSRISQRGLGRGVIATGTTEPMDNTILFIGHDRIVYRMSDVAKRISDHGIEERIRASTTWSTFQYAFEGHLFFCIRLDTETLAFDVSSSTWPELATYGREPFTALCAVTIDGLPYFGTDFTGTGIVATFGAHGTAEQGAAAFERVFHAGFITSNVTPVDNVIVEINSGSTPIETGLGSDPVLEMRFSRDGGRSFGNWRSARMGAKGQYRRIARFGGCGSFGAPGALFEFRCTENVPLRVSAVRYNESLAGRGW